METVWSEVEVEFRVQELCKLFMKIRLKDLCFQTSLFVIKLFDLIFEIIIETFEAFNPKTVLYYNSHEILIIIQEICIIANNEDTYEEERKCY